MSSGTTEQLTGIWGVENGTRFGQSADVDGEMFAVGWTGTLLHYHPNPDGLSQPSPDDGRWQVIAGPGVGGFVPRLKIDPYCPDFDGDGADDAGGSSAGGPDGWWSRADSCAGVTTTGCDDNCRTAPNGTERPVVDLDGDYGFNACMEAEDDGPDPIVVLPQQDSDGDDLGTTCDASGTADPVDTFAPTLFDVWAETTGGGGVRIVAVGADGAIVTYEGPDGSVEPSPPSRGLSDRLAWVAQQGLPYRFATDCHLTAPGTPPGQNCAESDRLPPTCPAQCSPYEEACDCAGPGATCELAVRCGAPRVFLSDVASTGADRGYAVGDVGTLFVFEGTSTDCVTDPPVGQIDTGVSANLFAVWPIDDEDLWLAGASGTLLHVAQW